MNPPHLKAFVKITLDFQHGMLTSHCERLVVAAIMYNGHRATLTSLDSLAPARYASGRRGTQSVRFRDPENATRNFGFLGSRCPCRRVPRELPIAGPIDLPQLEPR